MLLQYVKIENFRGFQSLELDIEETTVLIGENNCGKTSILEAIRLCLSRSLSRKANPFEDQDYHLSSATAHPGDAGPLRIVLRFAEQAVGEWPTDLIQALADLLAIDTLGHYQITLEVSSSYDQSIRDFISDWDFHDANGKAIPKAKRASNLAALQSLFSIFYLTAFRDAARDFSPKSNFWGPFLRNPAIPDTVKTQLEQELIALNAKILTADQRLKAVSTNLGKAQKVVTLGQTDTVSIDALPSQIWDLLSRAQVNVAAVTGASLPLLKHGAGTQSLASIFLFEAFLAAGLGKSDPLASSLLQIEEPEAHLHPSAVRALWPTLAATPGQKIIATHSGDLLSEVPIESIRRLRRTSNGVEVARLRPGALSPEELRKVKFHVRRNRGELFFARVWLLYEGETEYWLLSEVARLSGINLEEKGVRLVEYANVGVEAMLKLADEFKIAWHCVFDGDDAGNKNAQQVAGLLNGRLATSHMSIIPSPTIEHFVCEKGFGGIYEAGIAPQKAAQVTAVLGDPLYWEQVLKCQFRHFKVPSILKVIIEMERLGTASIPPFILSILNSAVVLGGQ
jgi:putative ATP-dependent endonuclease of OLD family